MGVDTAPTHVVALQYPIPRKFATASAGCRRYSGADVLRVHIIINSKGGNIDANRHPATNQYRRAFPKANGNPFPRMTWILGAYALQWKGIP